MQGNNQGNSQSAGQGNAGGSGAGKPNVALSWSQSANNVQQKPVSFTQQPKPSTPTPPVTLKTPLVPPTPQKAPEQKQSSGFRTLFTMFLVGIAAGFLIGWFWTREAKHTEISEHATTASENSSASETTNSSATSGTSAMSDSIIVSPLQDAGTSVDIVNAPVTVPTWVVVYDVVNGNPGHALGATLFFPTTKGATIDLVRATLPNKTYFVGERVDDGDKTFSMQKDTPVLGVDGKTLLVAFQTK